MRSPWAREYIRTPNRYIWGTEPSELARDVVWLPPARTRVLELGSGEGRDSVAGYMQRADLHYPVGADTDTQIAANYRVLGIPTHIFVDRDGIIREMRVGGLGRKTMEKKLALIIGSP